MDTIISYPSQSEITESLGSTVPQGIAVDGIVFAEDISVAFVRVLEDGTRLLTISTFERGTLNYSVDLQGVVSPWSGLLAESGTPYYETTLERALA